MRQHCNSVRLVGILFCALTLPAAAIADGDGQDILDKRISLNLIEASLQELFKLFPLLLDAELAVDCDRNPPVSLRFEKITARTGLNALCESAGCRWELRPGTPSVLRFSCEAEEPPQEQRPRILDDREISLDLIDASAAEVFRLAAKILHAELSFDESLSAGTVTISRAQEPVSALLTEMCDQIACEWSWIEGYPPTLEITPRPSSY